MGNFFVYFPDQIVYLTFYRTHGMIGVLSGMNSEGLTVTINAAKGPVPLASATRCV